MNKLKEWILDCQENGDDGTGYEQEGKNTTEYDYNVQFVGNYWVLTTKVSIELEDTVGNMSEEAKEKAVEFASNSILEELGIYPLNFAHSCLVTLVLKGEEHQL
jgi:hypothetical protein